MALITQSRDALFAAVAMNAVRRLATDVCYLSASRPKWFAEFVAMPHPCPMATNPGLKPRQDGWVWIAASLTSALLVLSLFGWGRADGLVLPKGDFTTRLVNGWQSTTYLRLALVSALLGGGLMVVSRLVRRWAPVVAAAAVLSAAASWGFSWTAPSAAAGPWAPVPTVPTA